MKKHWKKNFRSRNGLTPDSNRFISGLTRLLIHSSIILVGYRFWGAEVFGDPWFYLIHLIAYLLTGGLFYASGFWPYWKFPRI